MPARFFRGRLRRELYDLVWAVNSRYACLARSAELPYLVWEATPIRDELRAMSVGEVRQAGRGSGAGLMAHRASLRLGERLERRALADAIKVFTMSEYTRARVLEIHRLPPSHVEVLLHPPSRAFLDALGKLGGLDARTPYGGSAVPRLLFVGRADDPRKNLTLLFDVCRLLDAGGFPVRLSVVGPHSDQWARLQHLPANVELLGSLDLDRLAAMYLSHDALVLSSRQEGFGIVVAEAMHAGLPVVTTPCGGPEDILRRSGGGVIGGFTARELADAIRGLLSNRDAWRRASQDGAQFAADELSLTCLTASVRRILTQTIESVPPARASALATPAAV